MIVVIKKSSWWRNLISFDWWSTSNSFRHHIDLTSGDCRCCYESAVLSANHVQIALSNFRAFFGSFQFTLHTTDASDWLSRKSFLKFTILFIREAVQIFFYYLFIQLTLECCEFCVSLVQLFLEQQNIPLIFFTLDNNFFDCAFLLSQDFDGFSVIPLLWIQLKFQVTNVRFQFWNGSSSSNNCIGFDFLEANWKVLKWKSWDQWKVQSTIIIEKYQMLVKYFLFFL